MTMTREEAKEVIEDIIIDVRRTTAEEDKALRMAIEALQWQDRILTQIEDIMLKGHGERREPDECE